MGRRARATVFNAICAATNSLMHFSQHQMKGDADTCICANCGASDGHMPQLNKTGKKYVFEDPCCFAGNSLNVKKTKTIECSFPLKNHPVTCPSCNEKFWRFDLQNHFKISHTEEIIPGVAVIPEAEKSLLQKKKSFRKNAFKKEDLERLNDSELILLPLTDFWDSKKKNWKTNAYGNFGKRHCGRMKNLFGQEKF